LIRKAIRDVMVANQTIVAGLASYKFGGTPGPAIFTAREVIPDDAALPAAILTIPTCDSDQGDRGHKGGNSRVDIRLYGGKAHSSAALESLAYLIWAAVDRADLSMTGFDNCGCIADPPSTMTDPDGFPGFLIQARVGFQEA